MAMRTIHIIKPLVRLGAAGNKRDFRPCRLGTVLVVGKDIDEATAESWVRAGYAAENKAVPEAPENKGGQKVRFKRRK